MSESERIRLLQQQTTRFISRNKCVDSSLLTMTRQAQASKKALPVSVAAVVDQKDCPTNATMRGKGTNMEYGGILQASQGCAVCPTTAPADGAVVTHIVLPACCTPAPPSTVVQPCSVPGYNVYFPKAIYDGPNCTYNRITTPS
jgi:hypothetical protein